MLKKKLLAMCAVFFLGVLPVVFAAGIEIPGGTGLSEDSFAQVFDRVLNWMLMIFVILATMAFVVTGLQFIFSFGGASGTQESAKKNFTYTIIAIFIVGGALIILNTIVGLLGNSSSSSTSSNIGGGSQNTGLGTGTYGNNSNNDYTAGEFNGSSTNGVNNNDYQANEFEDSPTNGAEEISAYEPGPH